MVLRICCVFRPAIPSSLFLLKRNALLFLPAVRVSLSWWRPSRGRWPRRAAPAYWSTGRPPDRSDRSPAGCGRPRRSRGGSRWRWSGGSSSSPARRDSPSLHTRRSRKGKKKETDDQTEGGLTLEWKCLSFDNVPIIKTYLLPVPLFCSSRVIHQD